MDDTLPRKDGSFPTGIMKWNDLALACIIARTGGLLNYDSFVDNNEDLAGL